MVWLYNRTLAPLRISGLTNEEKSNGRSSVLLPFPITHAEIRGDELYYSDDDESYFQNKYTGTSHAVVIVGRDDNYSKENFRADMKPQNDGAWLIRNSWGPNVHGDGYF